MIFNSVQDILFISVLAWTFMTAYSSYPYPNTQSSFSVSQHGISPMTSMSPMPLMPGMPPMPGQPQISNSFRMTQSFGSPSPGSYPQYPLVQGYQSSGFGYPPAPQAPYGNHQSTYAPQFPVQPQYSGFQALNGISPPYGTQFSRQPTWQFPYGQQFSGPNPGLPIGQQNYGQIPVLPIGQQNYGQIPVLPIGQQNYGQIPVLPIGQQNYGPIPGNLPFGYQNSGVIPGSSLNGPSIPYGSTQIGNSPSLGYNPNYAELNTPLGSGFPSWQNLNNPLGMGTIPRGV